MLLRFLLPVGAELRATITASEIAGVAEVDFYITGHPILITGAVGYAIKVQGCPGLAAAVVAITELTKVLHVPAVLTFLGSFSCQHHATLLFLVFSVVDTRHITSHVFGRDTMQGRMIAGVGMSRGEMQADLFPFGQAETGAATIQALAHALGISHELAAEVLIYFITLAHKDPTMSELDL